MIHRRLLCGAPALVILLALGSGPGRAAGDEDAALDDALRSAHALVAAERWADGEAALRRIFADHPGDPRVRVHLREIEEDLEICLFRKSRGTPDAAEIFGAALKRFVPATLEVELEYAAPSSPSWVVERGNLTYFPVRFTGDAAIEFTPVLADPSDAVRIAVLDLVDPERSTGYVVVPYVPYQDARPGDDVAIRESIAVSFAPSGIEVVTRKECADTARPGERLAVSRIGGALSLRRGTQIVFAVRHGGTRSGFVGVMGTGIRDVKLRGRFEAASYQRLVADRLDAAFRRWVSDDYDRTREIPAWARISQRADSDELLSLLPRDGRFLAPEQTDEVVRFILRGDEEGLGWGSGIAELSEPITARYFTGLVAFGRGEWARAVGDFNKVLIADSEFVTARLFRAVALARMRQTDRAKSELDSILAARPHALRAYLALAEIAMDEFEFDRALGYLVDAASHGGYGADLDELSLWVHRARAGPLWTRRFRTETAHFVVESDLSEAKCAEVGGLLESMQSAYAEALGPAPAAPSKARVYVFASEDGYQRHATALGMHAESTAGAYHPLLRTLFLFVPNTPDDLRATVRHEGFHQYLARAVGSPPDWFNEGWAQVVQGDGDSDISPFVLRTVFVPRFVPVRRLVELDHEQFMRNADVNYVESRRLVDLLLRTREPRLTGVLRAYLDALKSGASRREANEKVLGPVMDLLEAAFANSLR